MKNSLTSTTILTFIFAVIAVIIIAMTLARQGKVFDEPRVIANPQPTPIASEPVPFYPNEGKE